MTFWTTTEHAKLEEMTAAGKTGPEIATALGRSHNSVIGHAHRSAIHIQRACGPSPTDAAVWEMRQSGARYLEIERALRITTKTVYRALGRHTEALRQKAIEGARLAREATEAARAALQAHRAAKTARMCRVDWCRGPAQPGGLCAECKNKDIAKQYEAGTLVRINKHSSIMGHGGSSLG